MSQLVRGHKKINQSVINAPSEITLKAFYSLLGEFNKQLEYNDLELSKLELWKACGIQSEYTTKDFDNLIKNLTRSETYKLKNKEKINGSIFITKEVGDIVTIHIPRPFREYIFNRKDINLMHKAKCKEKMNVAELDYYDSKVKNKSKELVLLNKAHILGLKGKYNIRIYTLLKQWDSVGKYEKNWSEFKEILEIPKSYKSGDIDLKILSKVKKELLKANIKITKIEKIKKGRSIDKIRILFKTISPVKDTKKTIKALSSKEVTKNVPPMEEEEQKFFDELKEITMKILEKKRKDLEPHNFLMIKSDINKSLSFDVLTKLIVKHKLND